MQIQSLPFYQLNYLRMWCSLVDLNHRHSMYKTDALTN